MRKGLPAVLTCLHRGFYLGVAQLVERLPWGQDVVGLSPATQTKRIHISVLLSDLHHVTERNLQTQVGFAH